MGPSEDDEFGVPTWDALLPVSWLGVAGMVPVLPEDVAVKPLVAPMGQIFIFRPRYSSEVPDEISKT